MADITPPEDRRPYLRLSEGGDELGMVFGPASKVRYWFRQIGCLGQSGAFYTVDESPSQYETGPFTAIWVIAHSDRLDESARSLMDDLPPEVRPLAAAIGIPDQPVDQRERAREWIAGFLAASDEDRVNCVALMLGAADDAIRCAVNHKPGEYEGEAP